LAVWLVLDLFCYHHLVALSYSGKAIEAFSFTPTGYEMASKIVAWGILPLISTKRLKKTLTLITGVLQKAANCIIYSHYA